MEMNTSAGCATLLVPLLATTCATLLGFAAGGPKARSHGEARSAVRELDTECRHVRAEQLR